MYSVIHMSGCIHIIHSNKKQLSLTWHTQETYNSTVLQLGYIVDDEEHGKFCTMTWREISLPLCPHSVIATMLTLTNLLVGLIARTVEVLTLATTTLAL